MKTNNASTIPNVEFTDYYIYIHSIGFSGAYSKSKNGQYIVAWKDGHFRSADTGSNDKFNPDELEQNREFYRDLLKEVGNPDWTDRFLEEVETKILKEKYDDWRDQFYLVIKAVIPDGNWDEWYDRFIEIISKNLDKAVDVAIARRSRMSENEFKESTLTAEKDAYDEEKENNWTEWQDGEIVLLRDNDVVFRSRLERPFTGRVANNGLFIINDAMVGDGTKSTFWAFSNTGIPIIQHLFSANTKAICISDDGRYAICQLFNSKTTDGNTVALFDLKSRTIIWQMVPETWMADSLEFNIEDGTIYLVYGGDIKFGYSLDGKFIDKEKWRQHRLKNGSGFDLMKMAEELQSKQGKPASEGITRDALSLYLLAADRLKDHPYFRAQAYRKIGELYETLGDTKSAIINYELAIRYNPNIGVKKKLQALKDKKQ